MFKKQRKLVLVFLVAFLFIVGHSQTTFGQGVKRLIIIKADGVPTSIINRYVELRDSSTGKSRLPWIEEVFYKNGTRLDNFYVRGISLSAPAWSLLDTGQHLQIKGNVEFNRYTLDEYYYLNFIPFQIDFGLKNRVDMVGVELLDRLKIPLLIDAFPFNKRIAGYQLFQRDNRWDTFAKGFATLFQVTPNDLIDEYTMGFGFRYAPFKQVERDIVNFVSLKPEIDYFDYYTGDFDHISHHVNDDFSKYNALKELDLSIGRIWTAIQNSSRANETAVVLVSDHGSNSVEGVYSQGFNLLKVFGSENGGGHHIITKRRPLTNYHATPEIPFFPYTTTLSKDSPYLQKEIDYPTVLLDFDGNERASIYFRDNDFNLLHILFKQLQNKRLRQNVRKAATEAFFDIINRRHEEWQFKIFGLQEELMAANRLIESQKKIIAEFPKEYTEEEIKNGINQRDIRFTRLNKIAQRESLNHQGYIRILNNLISLDKEKFDPTKLKIEDYIAKGAMGERNSVYKLQNYVIGLSSSGLVTDAQGELDLEKSFRRINYFEFLFNQKVRNNVQKKVGNSPVDFVSTEIPLSSISSSLTEDLMPNVNPIWIYEGEEKQALILSRRDAERNLEIRYLPISNLKQLRNGDFSFQIKEWDQGFPLQIFEDENLNVSGDRKVWLNKWHTETEWLNAVHKTLYSNGIISLTEQLNEHPINYFEDNKNATPDEKLIQRMYLRQLDLVRADIMILANNHWNFDGIGFNPGGNHGSFFRISTHSTFMLAGGNETNIPRGLHIATPYDSLSFVPTIFALMGKVDKNGNPNEDLYQKGFRKFPGPIVKEIFEEKMASK